MEPGSGRPVDYQVSGCAKTTSREIEPAVICFHRGVRFSRGSHLSFIVQRPAKAQGVAGIVKPVIQP